jgi:hypothetical protein
VEFPSYQASINPCFTADQLFVVWNWHGAWRRSKSTICIYLLTWPEAWCIFLFTYIIIASHQAPRGLQKGDRLGTEQRPTFLTAKSSLISHDQINERTHHPQAWHCPWFQKINDNITHEFNTYFRRISDQKAQIKNGKRLDHTGEKTDWRFARWPYARLIELFLLIEKLYSSQNRWFDSEMRRKIDHGRAWRE